MREILGAIDAAECEITSARVLPRGHLRVHTFPIIAVHHLAPTLPDFLERYPQITFDFMVTNRIVDLIGENVDISLRIGPLKDSGLVVRKIVDLTRVVCASPSYIARHGRPIQPSDLLKHSCLTVSRNPGSTTWPFQINGKLSEVEVKGPIIADSAGMLLELAIKGAGILRVSEHVVASSIRKGLLQPLLQDVGSAKCSFVCTDAVGPASSAKGKSLYRFFDRAFRLRTVADLTLQGETAAYRAVATDPICNKG